MISGLYSAASGLLASQLNQEVVARNLAHLNVPGFRRSYVLFETREAELEGASNGQDVSSLVGTHAQSTAIDFSPGTIERTGRGLDVAIMGDGFFVVEGGHGPLYTRNGVFHLNEQGELVNGSGMRVLASGGPIVIPAETPMSSITISTSGAVRAGGLQVGTLDIVSFPDNSRLNQVGTTLFAAPNGVPPEPSDALIQQGARELSNVNSVDELVRMIAGLRHYESSQRALKALDEAIHQNTNPTVG